jgi:hypothetical protein
VKRPIRWAALLAAIVLLFSSCDALANLLGFGPEGGPKGNWDEAVWNENSWQ